MDAPSALSLAPVVVAIGLALWTRQVLVALGSGVLLASFMLVDWQPWHALVYVVDPLLIDALADRDHVKVLMFTVLVAATLEVVSRGKGTRALVDRLTRRARDRRSGQVATWGAGMLVFFDDYANCLIVGNSMRPLCDRLRISREKLAYLVDSTAAPMATLALISTWVGYEVSLIGDALAASGSHVDAYAFFIEGLPYRFYPFLALVFGLTIAASGRDFGPMREAEARALERPAPEPQEHIEPHLAWLAAIPIGALVGVTAFSLWAQGVQELGPDAGMLDIIGASDGYDAMLHGSIAGLTLASVLAFLLRALKPVEMVEACVDGVRSLAEPLIVLLLAWSLGRAVDELQAAVYLVDFLGDAIPVWLLPSLVFVVSAAVAFATGTSFGTMAVLIPLAIPLAFAAGGAQSIVLAASASVLAGATWGDHCSPISDTTVLSSTGAGCDLATHVQTQLPYAIAAGLVSILFCSLPAGLGVNPWLCLLAGSAACVGLIWALGKAPEPEDHRLGLRDEESS
jgi:Na+/H+ antiporter NhaC